MVLQIARPWKHPKTGVYYLRKRVPTDVVAIVGRRIEKRSLGTKDAGAARRLHTEALACLEERWRNLRSGLFRPTPREIAAIAGDFYRAIVANTENGMFSVFGAPLLHRYANDRTEKPFDPQAQEAF